MNPRDVIEITKILREAKEYRPYIKMAISELFTYGPEFAAVLKGLARTRNEILIERTKTLKESGLFTDDQIMVLLTAFSQSKQSLDIKGICSKMPSLAGILNGLKTPVAKTPEDMLKQFQANNQKSPEELLKDTLSDILGEILQPKDPNKQV